MEDENIYLFWLAQEDEEDENKDSYQAKNNQLWINTDITSFSNISSSSGGEQEDEEDLFTEVAVKILTFWWWKFFDYLFVYIETTWFKCRATRFFIGFKKKYPNTKEESSWTQKHKEIS
jgi:hypothetical protein